ncbi:MAG: PfkB family carbohydrate kinase, partial [Desulfosarcinaceae bacterium]
FIRSVEDSLGKQDMVLAADFGHGAISANCTKMLSCKAPFLAVNTQANAGNRGFHTISKYRTADYISIAEHELRLEMRDLKSSVGELISKLYERVDVPAVTVTRGRSGCIVSKRNCCAYSVPALARNIVDRVGCGDALLAITSLAVKLNVDEEMVGFLGNVAGALAVETMGNKKAISKKRIKQYVHSLFAQTM